MTQKNIYIFDLHNTLYDEVIEYGGAIQAAIDHFIAAAGDCGRPLDKEILYRQLSDAHAHLGSDWDDDVWAEVPELRRLEDFRRLRDEAVAVRARTSEALTRSKSFTDTVKVIKELKQAGHVVYVATEATQNAASEAIAWLGLDGVVDAAYAWPFNKPYRKRTQATRLEVFPANPHDPALSLQKPHPLIIGKIILDEAKRNGLVPPDVTFDTVFDFAVDRTLDVSTLEKKIAVNPANRQQQAQAQEALRAIRTVMHVKDGPCREAIEAIKARCFYVGDSFFKDGFLARNAGVPFIHAAYGKKLSPENRELHERGKETLFRVTGWDKFLIRLTQEAGQLPELTGEIVPYHTCEDSFREFVDFERGKMPVNYPAQPGLSPEK